MKDRPDIDRWILSDLQLLIQAAREAFTSYNTHAFCTKAEEFIDDKLSNWYVRRNRRRLWKSEKGADKQAAYETLYTVLVTLTKLCAPVMPFLCETMYQNLAAGGTTPGNVDPSPKPQAPPSSVHHCAYPIVDAALIDAQLSQDMDALLRLVSLGSAARNTVKLKVRQPLGAMIVWSDDEQVRNAARRFADQLCDELNIKEVTVQYDPEQWPPLTWELLPNMKAVGAV